MAAALVTSDLRLLNEHFPRASAYNPEWLIAGVSGGANPLWMTEWLTGAMDLRPGMRVLDLGCGRGLSSIFLHREFGVDVWSTDLWFDAGERQQRIRDAGADGHVFPIHADSRQLPFAPNFFDAIISIDSFPYYGTDAHYLGYLARFVRPDGEIGIAGAGVIDEIEPPLPEHLRAWWTPDCWALHSAAWWQQHWERTGVVEVTTADTLQDGWRLWLDWMYSIAPDNSVEIAALQADAGRHLGYVRVVAKRTAPTLDDPIRSIETTYEPRPLLR